MGDIKSSYELAMERLKDLPSDKEGLRIHRLKDQGKRLLAAMRKDSRMNVAAAFPKGPDEVHVKEGFLEALLANIVLPANEEQMKELSLIRKGFSFIVKREDSMISFFAQLEELFQYYLQNTRNAEESLKDQFTHIIRQKEQMLEKQGMRVNIDVTKLPEFIEQLRTHRREIQRRSEPVLNDLKKSLRQLVW